MVPLFLTSREFAVLTRCCEETVRRRIRSREIEAHGRPLQIPRRELVRHGVSLVDASEIFPKLDALEKIQAENRQVGTISK